MASLSRRHIINLYRMMIRESQKFPTYNYRTYALRRIKDGFRENMKVENPKALDVLLSQAHESLALIKRQVSVGQMYTSQRTILEDISHH